MGARAQVLIKDTGVYLYTHWGAETIQDVVKDTIKQGWRLFDPEYFTRILLENMIGEHDEQGTETGFGIGTSQHSDIEKLIIVDCSGRWVEVSDLYNPDNGYGYGFEKVLPKKIEVLNG